MAAPSTSGARPWADLPTDMVHAIVDHLDIFSTARLAAVCVSWARAIATNTSLPFGTPCILMSRVEDGQEADQESDDDECTFKLADFSSAREFNPWSTLTFPAFIRAVRNRWWVGAKAGWLATVDEQCNAQLVNPYTGDQIDLPAIVTIPDVEPTGYQCGVRQRCDRWVRTFRRIVICETPSGKGDEYLVIAIVTRSLLAVVRGGDQSWTALENPSLPMFHYYGDTIVHKGKVFAVDGINGNIYVWDLRAGACPEPELVRPPRVSHDDFKYLWNLAESADGRRLLLACTYGRNVWGYKFCYKQERETVRYEGEGVRLYELDVYAAGSDGDGWSRVTSLGDRALFLGANYPFFASVNHESSDEQLLRPNSVCFAVTRLFEYRSEDYDVVVFDLDDQKHRQVTWCYFDWYDSFQTPIWFRPTLGK